MHLVSLYTLNMALSLVYIVYLYCNTVTVATKFNDRALSIWTFIVVEYSDRY